MLNGQETTAEASIKTEAEKHRQRDDYTTEDEAGLNRGEEASVRRPCGWAHHGGRVRRRAGGRAEVQQIQAQAQEVMPISAVGFSLSRPETLRPSD
ncbi:MAG TPA: hypothetical protein VGI95_05855 [Caulobacteraceae bacterium]